MGVGQEAKLQTKTVAPLPLVERLDRCPRRHHHAFVVSPRLELLARDWAPAAGGESVERAVSRDLQQPRPKRRLAPEPLEAMEGAEKRVLGDIGALVFADDAGRHPQDDVLMSRHELLEGSCVTVPASTHEARVGIAGRCVGCLTVGDLRGAPHRRPVPAVSPLETPS